jgi:hypothetical protein
LTSWRESRSGFNAVVSAGAVFFAAQTTFSTVNPKLFLEVAERGRGATEALIETTSCFPHPRDQPKAPACSTATRR